MESFGIPEKYVKLNTPVPAPHIITSYYSSPPFFSQVKKSVFRVGQVKCVRGRGGNRGGEKMWCVRKGGKHRIFIWRGNYGVSWNSWRICQVEYPCTCTPYNSFLLFTPSLLSTGIKSVCRVGQGNFVRRRGVNRGFEKSCCVGKGGNHRIFIWRGNNGVSWNHWRISQV